MFIYSIFAWIASHRIPNSRSLPSTTSSFSYTPKQYTYSQQILNCRTNLPALPPYYCYLMAATSSNSAVPKKYLLVVKHLTSLPTKVTLFYDRQWMGLRRCILRHFQFWSWRMVVACNYASQVAIPDQMVENANLLLKFMRSQTQFYQIMLSIKYQPYLIAPLLQHTPIRTLERLSLKFEIWQGLKPHQDISLLRRCSYREGRGCYSPFLLHPFQTLLFFMLNLGFPFNSLYSFSYSCYSTCRFSYSLPSSFLPFSISKCSFNFLSIWKNSSLNQGQIAAICPCLATMSSLSRSGGCTAMQMGLGSMGLLMNKENDNSMNRKQQIKKRVGQYSQYFGFLKVGVLSVAVLHVDVPELGLPVEHLTGLEGVVWLEVYFREGLHLPRWRFYLYLEVCRFCFLQWSLLMVGEVVMSRVNILEFSCWICLILMLRLREEQALRLRTTSLSQLLEWLRLCFSCVIFMMRRTILWLFCSMVRFWRRLRGAEEACLSLAVLWLSRWLLAARRLMRCFFWAWVRSMISRRSLLFLRFQTFACIQNIEQYKGCSTIYI